MVIFFVEDNMGLLCQTINFFHRNVKDVKILWVQFSVPTSDVQNRSQTVANCFWPIIKNVHLGWSNQISPPKKTLLISPMHLKSLAKATRCEKWGCLMWRRFGLSFRISCSTATIWSFYLSIFRFRLLDGFWIQNSSNCCRNRCDQPISRVFKFNFFGGKWCGGGSGFPLEMP